MSLSRDFAYEGFRIIRARPWLAPVWGLLNLLKIGGGLLVISLLAGDTYTRYEAAVMNAVLHPGDVALNQAVMVQGQALMPALMLNFGINLAFNAILGAAILRAVLKPAESAFAYIRLGKDELIQVIVSLSVILVIMALSFTALMGMAFLAAVPFIGPVLAILSPVLLIGLIVWALTRLSLSWAASFMEGRLALGTSLLLTKGRAGPLALGFGLAMVMGIFVLLLLTILFALPLGFEGLSPVEMKAAFVPDLKDPLHLIGTGSALAIACLAQGDALFNALMAGAGACVWLRLQTPQRSETISRSFRG